MADAKPLLGVIACNRMVGVEMGVSVLRRYLESSARYMDASLVIIPSLPEFLDAPRLAGMIDGLLLTGSPSNVAGQRYRLDAPGEGPFDVERDESVMRMVEAMAARARPVFGICRGLQELNVAMGGTLRRDLSDEGGQLAHHAPQNASLEEMFAWSHPVALTPGGRLAGHFGGDGLDVNSVHYQGVDKLAPGLKVEARAPDGIVEAVSGENGGSQVLAVQWHPEWQAARHVKSQKLFALFGQMLRSAA